MTIIQNLRATLTLSCCSLAAKYFYSNIAESYVGNTVIWFSKGYIASGSNEIGDIAQFLSTRRY